MPRVTYIWSNKYNREWTETWESTEYYCPLCGGRDVWEEQGLGDYYVGTTFMCAFCGGTFNLPFVRMEPTDKDKGILEAIRGYNSKSE